MLEQVDKDYPKETYTFRGKTLQLDKWTASQLNYALAANGFSDRYILSDSMKNKNIPKWK